LRWLAGAMILLEGHAQRDQVRGRWYFDPRYNALLNGTLCHGVPATHLDDGNLTYLIELLVLDSERIGGEQVDQLVDRAVSILPGSRRNHVDKRCLKSVLTKRLRTDLLGIVLDGRWKKRAA
jgi:hypothetical protein